MMVAQPKMMAEWIGFKKIACVHLLKIFFELGDAQPDKVRRVELIVR